MSKKNLKSIVAVLGGLSGVFYLLNPTAGVFELIPDNIPFIGNLDETAAVLLVLGCLRHFNIDLTNYFKGPDKNFPRRPGDPLCPKKILYPFQL